MGDQNEQSGASGILPDPSPAEHDKQDSPEKLHGLSREQLHTGPATGDMSGIRNDLAENSLLALVRTGIENDFETVVFPQYPPLREIQATFDGNSRYWNLRGVCGAFGVRLGAVWSLPDRGRCGCRSTEASGAGRAGGGNEDHAALALLERNVRRVIFPAGLELETGYPAITGRSTNGRSGAFGASSLGSNPSRPASKSILGWRASPGAVDWGLFLRSREWVLRK